MMILHNVSVETDCCNCCKDDPYARNPQPIMDFINNGLRQKIRSQTLYQKEKQRKILDMYKKLCASFDSCRFSSCSPIAVYWQTSMRCDI